MALSLEWCVNARSVPTQRRSVSSGREQARWASNIATLFQTVVGSYKDRKRSRIKRHRGKIRNTKARKMYFVFKIYRIVNVDTSNGVNDACIYTSVTKIAEIVSLAL